MVRTMNLDEQIRTTLKEQGADLVGFADVTDLPADMTGRLTAAVSIAVRLNPSVVTEISHGPTKRYYQEYGRVNELLGKLCRQIADLLTTCGICINACPWAQQYISCESKASG